MAKYDDIINLPHHQSAKYPRMSDNERAGMFSSFDALTGLDDALSETARLTDDEIELTDDAKAELDEKLAEISARSAETPRVMVMYFQPDGRKSGGRYITFTGVIKSADNASRVILFENGLKLPFDSIVGIELI